MEVRRFFSEIITRAGGIIRLDAVQSRHILKVLRIKSGEEVELFDGKGNAARASVMNVPGNIVNVRVMDIETGKFKGVLEIDIALGVLKEKAMNVAIQKLSELGVKRFIPIMCDFSVPVLNNPEAAQKKRARWRRISLESTKQCGRSNSMEILPPVKFKEFLEMDSGKKFFGSMDVPESFKRDIFKDNNEKVICAVGPEGGFSEKEDEELKVNHFTPVSLGLYRLRAETAAITAAAILSSLLRK